MIRGIHGRLLAPCYTRAAFGVARVTCINKGAWGAGVFSTPAMRVISRAPKERGCFGKEGVRASPLGSRATAPHPKSANRLQQPRRRFSRPTPFITSSSK
jgi:hypothetical protein